jgi:hypothetical protein
VDQLVAPDPLQKSAVPNETLPPPDLLHSKVRDALSGYDGSSKASGTKAAVAASPHKAGESSFLGDALLTLLYVLGFLVCAVVALRARVLWKQRKQR